MATTVTYNGVTLYNVVTRAWSEEVQMDESGTDALFVRVRMRFEGILHAQGTAGIVAGLSDYGGPGGTYTGGVQGGGGAPAWIGVNGMPANLESGLDDIRRRLWEPRKALKVAFGSQTALEVAAATSSIGAAGYVDTDNGPKPKAVEITHVLGQQVLRIAFSIDAAILPCPGGATRSLPPVLNNRWSIQETMDDRFFTTRTIRGRMRISSANLSAEAYRKDVIPRLENGFRRERIEFTTAANGLEAEYSITDRQVFEAAPWPASKIEGSQSVSTADGLTMLDEVNVRLEGHPGTPRELLLVRCVQVIESRMGDLSKLNNVNQDQDKQIRIVESASFTVPIGDANIVSASLRTRTVIGQKGQSLDFANLASAKITDKLKLPDLQGHKYDPRLSPLPGAHGFNIHAGQEGYRFPIETFIVRCALQSPCDGGTHGIPGGSTTPSVTKQPKTGERGETEITRSTSQLQERSTQDDLSAEQRNAPYTICTVENRIIISECKVHCPLGAAGENGATSAVVILTEPIARMEFQVEHERIGIMPKVPKASKTFAQSGITYTLLSHSVRVHPPIPLPGSTGKVYRAGASYVYAMARATTEKDTVQIETMPAADYENEHVEVLKLSNLYTSATSQG